MTLPRKPRVKPLPFKGVKLRRPKRTRFLVALPRKYHHLLQRQDQPWPEPPILLQTRVNLPPLSLVRNPPRLLPKWFRTFDAPMQLNPQRYLEMAEQFVFARLERLDCVPFRVSISQVIPTTRTASNPWLVRILVLIGSNRLDRFRRKLTLTVVPVMISVPPPCLRCTTTITKPLIIKPQHSWLHLELTPTWWLDSSNKPPLVRHELS